MVVARSGLVRLVLGLLAVASACGGGGHSGSVQLEDLNHDGQILLMAFGDSITAGVGDGPNATDYPQPPAGYPLRLQNLLKLPVINDGNPGERTSQGLPRLRHDLEVDRPDFVILLEGTNDVEDGHADEALSNMQSMIDSVFTAGGEPLLGTITPSCCDHQNQLPQEAIFFYNDQLRTMAMNNSVQLIDYYAAFTGGPEVSYPVDGSPGLIHVPEGLHPVPTGYDLMAETARSVFILP